MAENVTQHYLTVGRGNEQRTIAAKQLRYNKACSLGLFWLGGFMSDMEGKKALACEAWAKAHKASAVRFDYSGHGVSSGEFSDGTLSRWLEETVHTFESFTQEPQIIVGSSMGGWLALRLAQILIETGRTNLIKAIILIAPAIDFTHDLLMASFSEEESAQLEANGVVERPSGYEAPYRFYRHFIEDGAQHRLFIKPLRFSCPIHILQGMKDLAVPWQHAAKLFDHLSQDDVSITYVKDGDHSLSRPKDIELLKATITRMATQ